MSVLDLYENELNGSVNMIESNHFSDIRLVDRIDNIMENDWMN